MTEKNKPKSINLMRDLGYDESDPEVIEARAEAKAEAEAAAKSEAAGEATAEGGGYDESPQQEPTAAKKAPWYTDSSVTLVIICALAFVLVAVIVVGANSIYANESTESSKACESIDGTWDNRKMQCVDSDGRLIVDLDKAVAAHKKSGGAKTAD